MATKIVAQPAASAINPVFFTMNLSPAAWGEDWRNGSPTGPPAHVRSPSMHVHPGIGCPGFCRYFLEGEKGSETVRQTPSVKQLYVSILQGARLVTYKRVDSSKRTQK